MLQWVQMMITVCHIGSIWAFTAKIKELATAISSQESIFPDELRLKSDKIVKTLKSRILNMKIMFQTGERSSIFKKSTKFPQFLMQYAKTQYMSYSYIVHLAKCNMYLKLPFLGLKTMVTYGLYFFINPSNWEEC